MRRWVPYVMCYLGCVVHGGKETDEEFEDFMKKLRTGPMTYREQELNKMVEEKIVQFNEAVTESQSDDKEDPSWWAEYRLARYGEQSYWRAAGTTSQKYPHISTPTWKPGTPVINLRLKTDPTIKWLT